MTNNNNKRTRELVEVDLTPAEWESRAMDQAVLTQTLTDLSNEKKEVTKGYSARIEAIENKLKLTARIVRERKEEREMDVIYQFDTPTGGIKTVIRADNKSEIRREPMTSEEQQMQFSFLRDAEENPKQ